METDLSSRKNSLSGEEDKFSFPVIIESTLESDDQFEFGSHITTPGSPNSPADHLFYNGKLLPHVFPTRTCNNFSYSRSTSRTSSSSSKDSSFMSSRSNSTNSTRSSSARTSTSDRATLDQTKLSSITQSGQNCARKERYNKPVPSKPYQSQYSSSQRWQLIMAAPVLKHQGSGSRKAKDGINRKGSKKLTKNEVRVNKKCWFVKRVLRAFVSACSRCHAIEETTSGVMVEI